MSTEVDNPSNIITADKFKAEMVGFRPKDKDKKGRDRVRIYNTECNKPLYIQTPKMWVPFGVQVLDPSAMDPPKQGPIKYQIQPSFNDEAPFHKEFKAELQRLDKMLTQACIDGEWYSEEDTDNNNPDVLASMQGPNVRETEPQADSKYKPLSYIRLKLQQDSDNGTFIPHVFYNGSKIPVDIAAPGESDPHGNPPTNEITDVISKGCSIKMILSAQTVYLMENNFGILWRPARILVYPRSSGSRFTGPKDMAIDDDEENW
jgi:hypothetical protein